MPEAPPAPLVTHRAISNRCLDKSRGRTFLISRCKPDTKPSNQKRSPCRVATPDASVFVLRPPFQWTPKREMLFPRTTNRETRLGKYRSNSFDDLAGRDAEFVQQLFRFSATGDLANTELLNPYSFLP